MKPIQPTKRKSRLQKSILSFLAILGTAVGVGLGTAVATGAIAMVAMMAPRPAFAQEANNPKQREDLASVIALQRKPCGEVTGYIARGDHDYVAICKDGNRYRVHVKDGRVLVEKQ